jgi:hypothetical protein
VYSVCWHARHVSKIQDGGVLMLGPQRAGDGMHLDVEVAHGAVRFVVACARDAWS